MESGTSVSGPNNPTPTTPEPKKENDWRSNALVVNAKTVPPANTPVAPNAPRERSGNAGAIGLACLSLLIGLFGIIIAIAAISKTNNNSATDEPTVSTNGYYNGNSVEFEQTSIAKIVEKVTPSVVSIITSSTQSSRFGSLYSYDTQSAGTGMIVSSDGYILTNKHVVEGGHSFQVVTSDGESYDDVKLVAEDPLNDVAYLKINGVSDLPAITLGDSKTIAVGQPVLAIGNALGQYQNSVTQGIISGTGRSVEAGDESGRNSENLTDMLQTDAAINPGNSGGPLVNANGDVIGINTAVSTDGQGIGFAIPISATLGMLHNIIENGDTGRAYMGVTYVAITPEIAKANNLASKTGAYIGGARGSAVVTGGPAEQAGVKDGDIITKINDTAIGTAGSVSTLVGEYKPGDTIKLTILRDGQELTLNVTLAAYPN